ncbi:hypothetical protein CCACVL1_18437 [Corchorus capsularis]|uniref:Uncharacterized protein n=1 Tax=Corchorus capsularis TaxID=210143 RepID=A0A1R3HLB5_COCAP|nr:hypothetical protein CCACVL1_18437 [Corchorus capsularis]
MTMFGKWAGGNRIVPHTPRCLRWPPHVGNALHRFEYGVNVVVFIAKVHGGTCTQAFSGDTCCSRVGKWVSWREPIEFKLGVHGQLKSGSC